MQFRSEYKAQRKLPLDPHKPICLIGSCFSDNIGAKMAEAGWEACVNPCGVIYNPASIARILKLAISSEDIRKAAVSRSLTKRDGRWASWLFSGHFGGDTEQQAVESCLNALDNLREVLKSSGALIITLGTSYVYSREGEVVNNCHKYPEWEFSRRRMKVEECVALLKYLLIQLHSFNPDLRVIFTVSPVRHLRDGFAGNSRSKATLLLAVGALEETDSGMEYFPAYEIMNDDLRDYRFYADDLLHPSAQGVKYIWEKFMETYITPEGEEFLKNGLKESKRRAHRNIRNEVV